MRERGGAVVNEPFANRFGVREGDTVVLEPPGGPLEVEVVGRLHRTTRARTGWWWSTGRCSWSAFPAGVRSTWRSSCPTTPTPQAARDRLLAAARGRFLIEAFSNRQLKTEVLAAFERTFAITTALSIVAAVVAVIAVVTVLLTLVGERRRELATVRALGGLAPTGRDHGGGRGGAARGGGDRGRGRRPASWSE